MEVNDELISNLCKLSKLEIKDKEKYKNDLKEIINFMDNLNEFNDEVENTEINNQNIFREDIETPYKNLFKDEIDLIELMKKNNKYIEENHFSVPKIIE